MLKQFSIFFLLISSLVLTACYDDVAVSLNEPGVYKGATDPLVSVSKGSAYKERLRKRFDMVQTDR